MSLSSSLSGISFTGISSGIDTESIISKLLSLDQAPIQRLQRRQAELTQRLGLMSSFRGKLGGLSTAMAALGTPSAFQSLKATLGDTAIATATTASNATPGLYDLEVIKLAQAHKISSNGQSSATAVLALKGEFVMNGRTVEVLETDSLTSIAAKINATAGGVTANVIDGGAGNAYLSLTSKSTGASGAIQLADVTGNVLESIGVLDGTGALGTKSFAFSSKSSPIGGLLGWQSAQAGSFKLNGVDIAFDPSTGSLDDLAAAINGSGSGATASVVSDGGKFRLQLAGATSFEDTDRILAATGLVQNGFQNTILAALDASFKVDGITLSSATNTVSGVVPGVTLTLKKAGTTTIEIARDTADIRDKLDAFVQSFNDLVDFVEANGSFDKETFDTGLLFGDPIVGGIESALTNQLYSQLKGAASLFSSLSEVGISLGDDGKLKVDDAKLDAALTDNLSSLQNLFRSSGTTTVKALEFVNGTTQTKPSGAAGYQVVITALAQKQITQAEAVQSGPLGQDEVLTFTGSGFGGGSYEITLQAGMTAAEIVDRINSDSKLKGTLVASLDAGKLTLTAKEAGSATTFSVMSNVATGGTGWGAGTSVQAGTDIAGTINGEEAVGSGSVLTGKTGNANTDGLQVRYTGNTTGVIGSVTFSLGIADRLTTYISGVTEATSGLLSANDKSLQEQIDGIASQIGFRQDQVAAKKALLQARFSRMEQILSELQAQQARIAQFGK